MTVAAKEQPELHQSISLHSLTKSLDCGSLLPLWGHAACCRPDNPSTTEHPEVSFSPPTRLRLTAGCLGESGSRLHAVQEKPLQKSSTVDPLSMKPTPFQISRRSFIRHGSGNFVE